MGGNSLVQPVYYDNDSMVYHPALTSPLLQSYGPVLL